MANQLFFTISQSPCEVPYKFKVTGIKVYSLEEAIYHVYAHWMQSEDDFLSNELREWVGDTLGLPYIAARIGVIKKIEWFCNQIIAFLQLIDYFNFDELEELKPGLIKWEKRREWEKLKERGDYLMNRQEPDKAYILYKKALLYEENAALYNNLGIASMGALLYDDALIYLKRAINLLPSDVNLLLSGAEAAIYARERETALVYLKEVKNIDPQNPDIPYIYGLMHFEAGDLNNAIECFNEAISRGEKPDPDYIYKLADVYAKMRQYDKSLEIMEKIPHKDARFYVKQSELNALSGNLPGGIKSLKNAIYTQNDLPALWVKLAQYHRLDYDLPLANAAISKALAIDPENERARLEEARIKKAMGRTKEYQGVLNGILRDFKKRYRELYA